MSKIERLDHPVAVRPHRAQRVLLVPVRVCVPRQVEPWTRPTFAVMGRCEEAIDDSLVRVRCAVGDERVDLRWCGRQADEVERHAAQQPFLRGFRRWREPFGLQPRQDEAVDGRAWPALVANGWRRVPHRPDVGPVLRWLGRHGCRGLAADIGPGGALVDPPPDEGYVRIGQRVFVEGHPVLAVEAKQAPHEDAVLAVAGGDRRTAHAAAEYARFRGRAAAVRAPSSCRGTRSTARRGSAGYRLQSRPGQPRARSEAQAPAVRRRGAPTAQRPR